MWYIPVVLSALTNKAFALSPNMSVLLLKILVVACFLCRSTNGRTIRHKRQLSTAPVVPFNSDAEQLKNYPDSPIEAFFGTGAHTHHLPTKTVVGTTNPKNTVSIGDFNIEDEIETTNDYITYDHKVGGVDNLKQYGVNLDDAFSQYKDQLNGDLASEGKAPHPYFNSPTHFLGRSPFEHDVGVQYQDMQTALKGHHNIGGLKIEHAYQPSYPFNTYSHSLGGVNPFGDVDWSKHFGQFSAEHAGLTAQSANAANSAQPSTVSENSIQRKPVAVASNPFASVASNANQPEQPSNPFSSLSSNPFFRTR